MNLEKTVSLMTSSDYRQRFVAEYMQTKIRYEKLKKLNNHIEAADRTMYRENSTKVIMPSHDCPEDLLREQQRIMGEYLHILEVRAIIENVGLPDFYEDSSKGEKDE